MSEDLTSMTEGMIKKGGVNTEVTVARPQGDPAAQGNPMSLEQELVELRSLNEDLEATFSLRWKADARAINRWSVAHPDQPLTHPDHADLVIWLLEKLDRTETVLKNLVAQVDLVTASDEYRGVWECSQLHFGPYKGPKFVIEFDEARKLIKEIKKEEVNGS